MRTLTRLSHGSHNRNARNSTRRLLLQQKQQFLSFRRLSLPENIAIPNKTLQTQLRAKPTLSLIQIPPGRNLASQQAIDNTPQTQSQNRHDNKYYKQGQIIQRKKDNAGEEPRQSM
jgi:hypothetical protein